LHVSDDDEIDDEDMYFSLLIHNKAFFMSYKSFFTDEILESLTMTIKSNYYDCDEYNIQHVKKLRDMFVGKL
jgi:hypothetical protein